MTDHLGYDKGDCAGLGSGNHRNGTSAKTVLTEIGPVPLDVPRDHNGEPGLLIVPKHARRVEGFNEARRQPVCPGPDHG
jgi:transposase-like protein